MDRGPRFSLHLLLLAALTLLLLEAIEHRSHALLAALTLLLLWALTLLLLGAIASQQRHPQLPLVLPRSTRRSE